MPTWRSARRARSAADLEPTAQQEDAAVNKYDDIVQLQREFGNLAVTRWIEQRADFRRLTVSENRERTESREQRINHLTRWFQSLTPVSQRIFAADTAERVACMLGFSEQEARLARRYGGLLTELGLEATIDRIETTPEVEDRTRTALVLVIRTLVCDPCHGTEG